MFSLRQMQGFQNSIMTWWGGGGGGGGGIFFTGGEGEGRGIAQGILSIFQGFCDVQINIPYILNIS